MRCCFPQKSCWEENVLILTVPEWKIVEFANSIDPDEATHNELPDLDLHCLPLVFMPRHKKWRGIMLYPSNF